MCAFFHDPATTEIYTLSLHDALPIFEEDHGGREGRDPGAEEHDQHDGGSAEWVRLGGVARSEEHTSELQSQFHLVCRLLLEKKKDGDAASPRSPTSRPFNRRTSSRSR